ncbi:DUF1629 domain-containing protein [Lysobacter sp. K5869]|uniref:imm11 family protein n=1 Tax=Lysobacter sp. K5869 TaxID=2820808 RepID=UPI001C060860|nr:DUF1629 domain-containing protein [Lysobacter sp. K5869]QWP76105.1 DUF1629 domain-containing protein [Lysobacter sp. K5869]
MNIESHSVTAQPSDAPTGRFYVLQPDIYSGGSGHGLTFSNLERLLTPPRRILRPAEGGFPVLSELPVLIQSAQGRPLKDLEGVFSGYWLVSDELKQVFERHDAEGFAFTPCSVVSADGASLGDYHLCDVLRVIDVLDESRSKLDIRIGEEYAKGKHYRIGPGASLAFREREISEAHVFRTPFSSYVFCDRELRGAIIDSGCVGISLEDAADF